MHPTKRIDLSNDWWILQDVHDVGEQVGLPRGGESNTALGNQVSEWEYLDRLEHLQVALAENPYWGRELRYFNQAPWWYQTTFSTDLVDGVTCVLRFSNVDQYCKVWLNGTLLGEHEGYSVPFEFDVSSALVSGTNTLVVKVWSPWDDTIRGGDATLRTYQVERRLVKGTYEHDDTLVARDVNPVGIYGSVSLTIAPAVIDQDGLIVDQTLDGADATVQVRARLLGGSALDPSTSFFLRIRDKESGTLVATTVAQLEQEGEELRIRGTAKVENVQRWHTWDRGTPWLYEVELELPWAETASATIGFREVELVRDPERTELVLNGERTFVRGTSYFPDVYVSRMYRERYIRDLQAIRDAGFNLVRVHVHVELPEFYDLCDELGLAVMQDSEYNWTHPENKDFAHRLTTIYVATMRLLHNHPSVVTWIGLNEPGVNDPDGGTHGFAMTKSPGPAMLEAIQKEDSSRSLILGSYCDDDPMSGDSHNYDGSLTGPQDDYTVIDGSTEKLNTEFGIDAPGVLANLRQYPQLIRRLASDPAVLNRAQHYQYRLLKYYTEHYRLQRFGPCAGYVQFMFIDLSPQSWYGVLDYWGTPKPAWAALLESNQPVAVLLDQTKDASSRIVVINDTPRDLGEVTVAWSARRGTEEISSGATVLRLAADALSVAVPLELSLAEHGQGLEVRLTVTAADGSLVASNRYNGLFDHPPHVAGHPDRMSHELGMRLFKA